MHLLGTFAVAHQSYLAVERKKEKKNETEEKFKHEINNDLNESEGEKRSRNKIER